MDYTTQLVFGVGPYLSGTVFILGSILRYERGQYTWRTMSSQILHNTRVYRVGNILFHAGILALFFGHLIGLLTPKAVLDAIGISPPAKQLLAMIAGGIFGLVCLVGILIILWRRLFVTAVRINSAPMDTFIILLLALQLLTGLYTITVSVHHLDGALVIQLAEWAQHIVTFRSDAWQYMVGVPWPYRLHVFLGLIMFAAFPFSRLVHIWSWPWQYLLRPYQIVRSR
ncbi:respiratory nitrate reductase subunit gamma [Pelomicrobium sp.]|jgi:nitrate reductase gamma subunit|uniref:respiratory nitrate reductase subunit gamma n=1 Tax=Pelomicrobium sp. TaxID=2815319 RepID=UPI002FDE2357